jgi:galactonate dehydratase
VGRDPLPVEARYWDMFRRLRSNIGGVAAKAIAGIDAALWDIKGKALGVPVYSLAGGPLRDRVRLYWSHCGYTRARYGESLGMAPLRTYADVVELGREVVQRGYSALKTNLVVPGDPAGVYLYGVFHRDNGADVVIPGGATDQVTSAQQIREIERLIGAFREGVGDDVDICLDLNFNFRTESLLRIAKAVEKFNLLWLEVELYNPAALRQLKDSTSTRICTGENLYTPRGFLPYLQAGAMDVANIDVAWNGFTQSKKIADLAESFDVNIAVHNCFGNLSTLMSGHLCAATSNVRIMEVDVDDVPWKDDLLTEPLDIRDGCLYLSQRPGWGADLNEKVLSKHPWPG